MITKVKRVKNVGKFYDFSCQANELDWHKNTFLFAPNAYGKSTLVNIFRSLHHNDPKILRARRSLNALTSAEAVIIIDGVSHVFNGFKWDKSCPAIRIFGPPFIYDNILTHEIEHQHRKNIHRIIIGAQGVNLAEELARLKEQEKNRRQQLSSLESEFRSAGLTHTLDAFLAISAGEEAVVAGRIKKLEQDIKSKESETHVRTLGTPKVLFAPAFDLISLKTIASQKMATVHEEAERRFLAHVARNLKDKTQAKEFIQHGLDLVQADCPFCGQDLKNAAELLAAYRQYFDESFREYQQRLAQQVESFVKWNLDNELTTLVAKHNANTTSSKEWKPFIGMTNIPDLAADVEGRRVRLTELKIKAHAALEKKQKDSDTDVDLSSLDGLAAELGSLKSALDGYNATVSALTAKANDFVANLPKSDIDSIRRALAMEREIETRFKPEWKQWATRYQAAKRDVDDLFKQKNAKQKELENYTKAIFGNHQKRVNELLQTLGTDFEITDLIGKTDERANEVYSDFAFLILQKKVPIRTVQDDAPSFKNTLSEGDKSTLAFAFFVAALEKSQDLDKQIVVFDDPLSSLDENRREATARILMELAPKVKQLCVFTHKKDFLWMLFDKMSDNKVLQIRSDKKKGSRLEVFDVEEDRKSDYARTVDEMERYMAEDFGPTADMMQGNIRKVFETALKTKYYRTLVTDMKAKHGLATMFKTLFDARLVDVSLKARLLDLCNLTTGPHHGEIVDAPAKRLSRDEVIPLIREAFGLVEKV